MKMKSLLFTCVFMVVIAHFPAGLLTRAAAEQDSLSELEFKQLFNSTLENTVSKIALHLPAYFSVGGETKQFAVTPNKDFVIDASFEGEVASPIDPSGNEEATVGKETIAISPRFLPRILKQEVALRGDLPFMTEEIFLSTKRCQYRGTGKPHELMKKLVEASKVPEEDLPVMFDQLDVEHSQGPTIEMEKYYTLIGMEELVKPQDAEAADKSASSSSANNNDNILDDITSGKAEKEEGAAAEEELSRDERIAMKSKRPCAESLLITAVKLCTPHLIADSPLRNVLKNTQVVDKMLKSQRRRIEAFVEMYAPRKKDGSHEFVSKLKQRNVCNFAKHLSYIYGAGVPRTNNVKGGGITVNRVKEVLAEALAYEVNLWTRESRSIYDGYDESQKEVPEANPASPQDIEHQEFDGLRGAFGKNDPRAIPTDMNSGDNAEYQTRYSGDERDSMEEEQQDSVGGSGFSHEQLANMSPKDYDKLIAEGKLKLDDEAGAEGWDEVDEEAAKFWGNGPKDGDAYPIPDDGEL